MVAVNSTMLPLGTKAPDFRLPDPSGKLVSLADFKNAPALLVVFMCNHCPYVKHIRDGLAKLARDYRPHSVAVVDRKSTRLNSSHLVISYAVFCLKKTNT